MSWTPDQGALGHLAQVLIAALNPRDKTAQKNAEMTIKQSQADPSFANYLVYLTVVPSSVNGLSEKDGLTARRSAAVTLKNRIKITWTSMPPTTQEYVKAHILEGIKDPAATIRTYIGSVVTEIVKVGGGIAAWPQLLGDVISLIDWTGSVTPETQAGAMNALMVLCEDHRKALNKDYHGSRPLDALVPKLVEFTNSPTPEVRWRALASLYRLMDTSPPEAIQVNADNILHALTQRASDENSDVRRYVCRLFSAITNMSPGLILPHFDSVIDYILQQMSADPESQVALDAAEFFFENNEVKELHAAFGQNLSKIVPVLLNSMRFNSEAQERLQAEAEEDAEQEDREQDIKPQFATTKDAKGAAANSAEAAPGYAYDEDDDSDGEIDEDDEEGEDPEDEWSLRKCSAGSLDVFSTNYGDKIFEITLPYLMENLNHSSWPYREAAVLTLGAISAGCMDSVMPSLPQLVPYLITLLDDPTPVVRQITCWTLGRYSSWAAQLDDQGKKSYFEPIMEGLLKHMLDKNKKVQKAAISAFASLEDGAKEFIIPYGPTIARQFAVCFERFKSQNMYLLYDCVETLADSMGSEMGNPDMINTLMPSVITRWHLVDDNSKEMFPLLECLAYLASNMGPAFAPFAEPLFGRCVKIIQDHLEIGAIVYDQDKDFLVTSLDLLSAIIQALDAPQSDALVKAAHPNMFEMLSHCMRDDSYDVRQSAYALLGDCAIYVFSQVIPYVGPLMTILILQLDLDASSYDRAAMHRIINNACWSAGEISMRAPDSVSPFLDQLLEKLGAILFRAKIAPSLNENAAIAIGRLGFGHQQKVASHLNQLAPQFLTIMQKISWTNEKSDALQGFTNMVAINPEGLEQCLQLYLAEVGNGILHEYPVPQGFQDVLAKYQSMIGDGFPAFLNSLPSAQLQALRQACNL